MRIEIEIPKEFEGDYENDKFVDFFERVLYDIGKGFLCGNYERETTSMFIKAFAESKVAYDVEAVVAELEERKGTYFDGLRCEGTMIKINEAISIVRGKE